MNAWIDVKTELPPDTTDYLKVKDANGIEAFALPCYRPWTFVDDPKGYKGKSITTLETPVFDGWMVWANDEFCGKREHIGDITHWKINDEE